jgi:site-specific DNA-cytosine methylase
VGGFALGMQQAGIQIVRSMDFNPDALKVHRANIKEVRAIGLRRVVPPGYPTEPIPVPVDGKFQRGQIHKSRDRPAYCRPHCGDRHRA